MAFSRTLLWVVPLMYVACEPIAQLGINEQSSAAPPSQGGAGGSAPAPVADPVLIGSAGSDSGGAAGAGANPDLIQNHVCSVIHPGESHPEPIAVCCDMNEEEIPWRAEVFVHINEARTAADLPEFQRDAALDQAALAWAMHWSLHWDPDEKEGYPGRGYSPTPVAESCGTTASVIMATDAQEEEVQANGLIDPMFPAQYWETDENLSKRFQDPDFVRLGVGIYDGLLVGILGRED